MKTSLWAMVFWIIGFLANLGLSYALLAKAHWTKFRLFSIFVSFQVLRTVTLFAVRNAGGKSAYFWSFWFLAVLDYLLQLGLIVEIAVVVLRPFVGAVAKAKTQVITWSGLGIILAAIISMAISPSSFDGDGIWDTRVSLFTSLLTCQCYVALSNSINKLGIQRKSHVLAIGNGLALWSVVALARDGACAATRWSRTFPLLDQFQMIVYICVTIYWALALWRDEPRKEPATVEMIASAYVLLVPQPPSMNADDVGKRAS